MEDNSKLMLKLHYPIYMNFIKEHTKIESYNDRNYLYGLDEASSFNVSDKLVSALYKSAAERYGMIDFGNIPDSKGDIDRIKGIDDVEETYVEENINILI